MIRQAILLAAGLGTRMWPLSATRPKPLVPVANRPLLAHLLDSVAAAGLREAVVVVPSGGAIAKALGRRWKTVVLDYVVQPRPGGTGDALRCAREAAGDRFLVLNGDVWAPPSEIRALARSRGPALGFRQEVRPERYGVLRRRGSRVVDLVEKPRLLGPRPSRSDMHHRRPGVHMRTPAGVRNAKRGWVGSPAPSRDINAGLYALDSSLFQELGRTPRSSRGEIEVTWAVRETLRETDVEAVPCPRSLDVSYPWDLLALNSRLLEGLGPRRQGTVERGAVLKGAVEMGPGSRIRSGAYIEGPVLIGRDCDIGPNCHLRGSTAVGDRVRIGNAVEVKNSLVFSGSHIGHLSYVGDSVVGQNCNLGAGTITANLRLDEKPIRVELQGETVETGLRKLGAILGDGVHTSIHAALNVGTLLPPRAKVLSRFDA